MKLVAAGALALMMVFQFTGCTRPTPVASVSTLAPQSRPTASGIKPAAQVNQCCRAFAEGRISLDRCMENPACVANGRQCCMQAIQ